MRCLFTVDLEDYKHATMKDMGIGPVADPDQTIRGVENLLSAVSRSPGSDSVTFFTTGQVARDQPNLLASLAAAGHEIGCHTYEHENVSSLTPDSFERNLERTTKVLREASGQEIKGFRAPNFSVNEQCSWMYEILARKGYAYDSSMVTNRRRTSDLPYDEIHVHGGELLEFPVYRYNTVGNRSIRVIGGTLFRLLPVGLIIKLMTQAVDGGYTPIIYLHSADADEELGPIQYGEMHSLTPTVRLKWMIRQKLWTTATHGVVDKLRIVLSEFYHQGSLNAMLPSHPNSASLVAKAD